MDDGETALAVFLSLLPPFMAIPFVVATAEDMLKVNRIGSSTTGIVLVLYLLLI